VSYNVSAFDIVQWFGMQWKSAKTVTTKFLLIALQTKTRPINKAN